MRFGPDYLIKEYLTNIHNIGVPFIQDQMYQTVQYAQQSIP